MKLGWVIVSHRTRVKLHDCLIDTIDVIFVSYIIPQLWPETEAAICQSSYSGLYPFLRIVRMIELTNQPSRNKLKSRRRQKDLPYPLWQSGIAGVFRRFPSLA